MKKKASILETYLVNHLKKMIQDKRAKVALYGDEKAAFEEAKESGDDREVRAVAESFGLVIGLDLQKEIKPYLRDDIDHDDFFELFLSCVGRHSLFDFDEEWLEDWAVKVAAIANTEGLFSRSA